MASWAPWNTRNFSGCPFQETKTGSLLDLPAEQWSKTYIQIKTKMDTEHKIKLLPWPSQSPDLTMWAELKRRVQKRGPRTDLERFCNEEWFQVPFSVFYNLIRCYRRRLHAVLLGRLYKVLNSGVQIIVPHLVKISMRDFIFSEWIYFSLKVGFSLIVSAWD